MAKVAGLHTKGQQILLAFLFVLLSGCVREPQPVFLEGATMGTRYHITLPHPPSSLSEELLQSRVEAVLEQVNDSMSTYREDSEINRVSRSKSADWQMVSVGFYQVLEEAQRVSALTRGRYDITVGPLVDLWGFGPRRHDHVPPPEEIKDVLEQVGFEAIELDSASRRVRILKPRALDFSSLAKGYGVDRLAALMKEMGASDYLVEIGGEIRVSGSNPRQSAWQLAIEKPDLLGGSPMAGLSLSQGAVATSGNYRNFFEVDGVRYAHSIDATTGYPVAHELVSVTVVAETAMEADAWATALTILGRDAALQVAREQDLAVYLVSEIDGVLAVNKTSAIDRYLQ